MAERAEGFWAIALRDPCQRRVRAANMAQRRPEKRPDCPDLNQTKRGTPTLKPRLVYAGGSEWVVSISG
jgi:hypothetical protein